MAETSPHLSAGASAPAGDTGSYIDWPAILAGAVLASAVSLVLMTFGSAIGFSMSGPFGSEGVSPFWVAVTLAIWVLWVQLSAFMAGGYVTGRMRRRLGDATDHEVDVRDGIHGLMVWGTGVAFTAILAFGGIGGLASIAGQTTGAAVGAASSQAADATADINPFDYTVDLLFRTEQPDIADEAARAEASRILVAGVTGDGVTDEDRAYLANVVATRTGLSPDEAAARVDQVVAEAQTVQADIAEAAEQARIIAILAAFLTGAALVVSAAGAYFAAGMGGDHRDRNTIIPFFNRVRRT
ncbi:hypothetical protein [Pelagibacterium montanilacus]|uniref:hypothetical protein n=1 Tax=Pelagibacterium montanilacus TaxID=2185280 RepID=UPI000F8EDDCB|nr:hypothetical protein [Pelagibacterium montanilacus]